MNFEFTVSKGSSSSFQAEIYLANSEGDLSSISKFSTDKNEKVKVQATSTSTESYILLIVKPIKSGQFEFKV